MIGQTVGHYRIVEKLGQGGMGVVYKAHDTHLDRFVAIKVLPPDKVADPNRKRRFIQEAKAASALNHPNIIHVYDIASEQGVDYIAMEYVAGKTLDQLIGRKGLDLRTALSHAIQMTDALSKAHAAAIIHRDLKPSNVMVSEDGRIRVLDFGLAKLTEASESAEIAETASLGLDDQPRTDEGVIVGTVAYMSPEQAAGKKIDTRSDIFSFGSMLYEMVTGARAFRGDSSASTLAAVLTKDPKPPSEIVADLPREVEKVVLRCLRKDVARRYQTMADLKVELEDVKVETDSQITVAMTTRTRRRRRWLLWTAGAALVIAIGAVSGWRWRKRPEAALSVDITRLTYDAGNAVGATISPDGSLVAYTSDRAGDAGLDIWVQQTQGGKALRLTEHPAHDWQPAFSPDGARIAFRSERDGGGIYSVDALGGAARKLVDHGFLPRFSPDGSLIAFIHRPPGQDDAWSRLHVMPSSGGPSRVVQPDFMVRGLNLANAPVWSPDGRYLLFVGVQGEDWSTYDWWMTAVDGGAAIRTGANGRFGPRAAVAMPFAWSGDFVYCMAGNTIDGLNIHRIGIARGTWKVTGQPQRLTSGAGVQWAMAVSRDGRIPYSSNTFTNNFMSSGLDPDEGGLRGEILPVTQDTFAKFNLATSHRGKTVAFLSFSGSRTAPEIRWRDLASGRDASYPHSLILYTNVQLDADDSRMMYLDFTDGKTITRLVERDAASGRSICEGCSPGAFFNDRRSVLLQYGHSVLVRQDLETNQRQEIVSCGQCSLSDVALSWDDRWISFRHTDAAGNSDLYLARIGSTPAPQTSWIPLREDAHYASSAAWSPSGNLLYYISERDGFACIWAQRLNPVSKTPVGEPFAVHHEHRGRVFLNMPSGVGTVRVTRDRMLWMVSEDTGNVFLLKLPAE